VTSHGIVEVPDDAIWPTYAYANEARMSAQARQGRIKRLITEITTLKTGLAEGIWVKHGISRLDIMKVLIVGPQGTPYENGLFEFDLFCPLAFPIVSPTMKFKGTNGGTMSINPNLHPNGKGKLLFFYPLTYLFSKY
jgi:ubiquitin-protein ligase